MRKKRGKHIEGTDIEDADTQGTEKQGMGNQGTDKQGTDKQGTGKKYVGKKDTEKKGIIVGVLFLLACTAGILFLAFTRQNRLRQQEQKEAEAWSMAERMPVMPYPETVTYTLAKMTGEKNSYMPQGDTYEDNGYTRYLKEKLNVQNENVLELTEDENYDLMLQRLIIEGKMPDVMVVNDFEYVKKLMENDMVEDLTVAYENCASSTIKEIYDSYGEGLLDSVTYGGKLMALPSTQVYPGCSLLWLRDDWRKELGLKEPQHIEDVEEILLAFMQHDFTGGDSLPENSQKVQQKEKVGLVCCVGLIGMENSNYSMDPLFAAFQAYPQVWLKNEMGDFEYGSLSENTKEALACLHRWYEEGIIDENYMMRTPTEIGNMIRNNQCGAFFGWWWAPNNPLMSAKRENPEAEWKPYLITDEMGTVNSYIPYQSTKYVVVRKGYEHPELIMKITTALFDDARYKEEISEIEEYYAIGVDTTARPFVINTDYSKAVFYATDHIVGALQGLRSYDKLSSMEKTYYEQCKRYLEGETKDADSWAAYASRVEAVQLIQNGNVGYVNERYIQEIHGVQSKFLYDMEILAFMKIITGEEPVEYFDEFVEEWMVNGGEELYNRLNSVGKE